MPMKLLSADDFRDGAKNGGVPEGTVFRLATGEPEMVGDAAARTERFVFSDGSIDLAGDAIAPKGWELSDFKRNPVALFSHMSWDPPIGRAANVGVQNGKLVGDIEFATPDIYPFADTIYRLVKGGYLKAVSVGFKPLEWTFSSDKDRPYGIDFKRQSLLEISVCCVPCNPNALNEARSAGVDTAPLVEWAEKVLDCGGSILVPKAELESLRKSASDKPVKRYYVTGSGLTASQADALKTHVDGWLKDGGALVLGDGLQLKSLDDIPAVASAGDATDGAIVPPATCGRAKDVDCGMIDPAECAIHAEAAKSAPRKSGRRISSKNKALLESAMTHHESATKCIKDVLADPDDDGDIDDPNNPETDPPDDDLDPKERRIREARALKDSLKN